jgi:peroxiredoxin
MKFRYFTLLAIGLITLLGGCGGGGTLTACPPLGNITGVDNQNSPLNVGNLVNGAAPNFSWDCVDSNTYTASSKSELSQYAGKPVLLLFHKSMNCPGCHEQLPFIQGAYAALKDSTGLVVLAIYRSDQPADVKTYSQKNGIEHFMSLADPEDKVASKLGFAAGAPITVYIDKKGIIKKYNLGPMKSQADVEAIIKTL